MGNQLSRPDLGRCRAGMAELLTKAVAMTRKLERRLDMTDGRPEDMVQIDLHADPIAVDRVLSAMLLRKARIHTEAVLRANETSNLHSLAVQMRPILECAGQVVFLFHNLIIARDGPMPPERALALVGNRINVDHYQTLLRITKGKISRDELRKVEKDAEEAAAIAATGTKPKIDKRRRFTQMDKVEVLKGGRNWYKYLSKYFVHKNVNDWRGLSVRGGVVTMDRVEDEFAFASFMDYLMSQVALMNAYAALCPVDADTDLWMERTMAQIHEARELSKAIGAVVNANSTKKA